MPKPNKVKRRGPRAQQKLDILDAAERKCAEERGVAREEESEEPHHKKRKIQQEDKDELEYQYQYQDEEPLALGDRPFYGLLPSEQQEYFRRADELLELNDFPSAEERHLFLANVYQEIEGKELKVACSQSCSRLMERLIMLSTSEQKKNLFGKFAGNFGHLVQHRFASHCCEALFIHSGAVVAHEMSLKSRKEEEGSESMENLFLQTLDELEHSIPILLTSLFASHCLRALLVVLSGRPLKQSSSLLQSRKKEHNTISGFATEDTEESSKNRPVPVSFTYAIQKIISDIVINMDSSEVQNLATHPTGNPTLQMLLEYEFTTTKSASKKITTTSEDDAPASAPTLLSTLFPDDFTAEHSSSRSLLTGLLYDPVGSHVLELLLQHLPSKQFKSIYTEILLPKISSLAGSDIASYPLIRALIRLSREDLEIATAAIAPQLPDLMARQRTVIIKTLFERCVVRGVDTAELTNTLATACGSEPASLVQKILNIDLGSIPLALSPSSMETSTNSEQQLQKHAKMPKPTAQQNHASLLAQSLLSIPGPPQQLIQSALLTLSPLDLTRISLYRPSSRLLQHSLSPYPSSTPSSRPTSETRTYTRKILTTLLTPFPSPHTQSTLQTPIKILAPHPIGSYLVTTLFELTSSPMHSNLFVFCERIMCVLAEMHENGGLQESVEGRRVWKIWKGGMWKWGKEKWVSDVKGRKAGDKMVGKGPEGNEKGKGKTAIELARERWALDKFKQKFKPTSSKNKHEKAGGSSANATALGPRLAKTHAETSQTEQEVKEDKKRKKKVEVNKERVVE